MKKNKRKERCQYEMTVIEFFGLPTDIKEDTIIENVDFGMLVNLICYFHYEDNIPINNKKVLPN